MIFFKTLSGSPRVQPIVVFDATRSDDVYTVKQIESYTSKWLGKFSGRELPAGASYTRESILTFSLDYDNAFTHNAIALASSLKARFSATIRNVPGDLVSLLKIDQYTTQQNITALERVINNVVNSQVSFPAGVAIYKYGSTIVERSFTVYSTPYNSNGRLESTTLQIFGASYTDIVMKLNFAVSLTKRGEETLAQQLAKYEDTLGYKIVFLSGKLRRPVVEKYYEPMPVNKLIAEICKDNNMGFSVLDGTIYFYALSPKEVPPGGIVQYFSMRNSEPQALMCTPLLLTDYATADFTCELHNPVLFSSVGVFNDSGSPTLFTNLSKETKKPGARSDLYKFYVLAYTLNDGRAPTTVRYTATNNWLLSYIKLDAILENKIYLQ